MRGAFGSSKQCSLTVERVANPPSSRRFALTGLSASNKPRDMEAVNKEVQVTTGELFGAACSRLSSSFGENQSKSPRRRAERPAPGLGLRDAERALL